jgi:hypothetical protein
VELCVASYLAILMFAKMLNYFLPPPSYFKSNLHCLTAIARFLKAMYLQLILDGIYNESGSISYCCQPSLSMNAVIFRPSINRPVAPMWHRIRKDTLNISGFAEVFHRI